MSNRTNSTEPVSPNVAAALRRPVNYAKLPPGEQWVIDRRLGILDWDPTPEEIAQYKQAQGKRKRR